MRADYYDGWAGRARLNISQPVVDFVYSLKKKTYE